MVPEVLLKMAQRWLAADGATPRAARVGEVQEAGWGAPPGRRGAAAGRACLPGSVCSLQES